MVHRPGELNAHFPRHFRERITQRLSRASETSLTTSETLAHYQTDPSDMHEPSGPPANLCQCPKKSLPVRVILKDRLTPVSSVQHMI